jgi:hypothetical protein
MAFKINQAKGTWIANSMSLLFIRSLLLNIPNYEAAVSTSSMFPLTVKMMLMGAEASFYEPIK